MTLVAILIATLTADLMKTIRIKRPIYPMSMTDRKSRRRILERLSSRLFDEIDRPWTLRRAPSGLPDVTRSMSDYMLSRRRDS